MYRYTYVYIYIYIYVYNLVHGLHGVLLVGRRAAHHRLHVHELREVAVRLALDLEALLAVRGGVLGVAQVELELDLVERVVAVLVVEDLRERRDGREAADDLDELVVDVRVAAVGLAVEVIYIYVYVYIYIYIYVYIYIYIYDFYCQAWQ